MNKDEVHKLLMRVCDKATDVEMVNAFGEEIHLHRKLEILLGVDSRFVKRWILGNSIPSKDSIVLMLEFLNERD